MSVEVIGVNRGLTQRAFAKRLGIDPTTLARWEKGKGTPSKNLERMIAGLLSFASQTSIKSESKPYRYPP